MEQSDNAVEKSAKDSASGLMQQQRIGDGHSGTEEDNLVAEEGHLTDLAAILRPSAQINRSINKYVML